MNDAEKQELDVLLADLINKQHQVDGAILRLLQAQNRKIDELELAIVKLQVGMIESEMEVKP